MLRIDILAVGRMKQGAERELMGAYFERALKLGRTVSLDGFGVREIPEGPSPRAGDRRRAEGARILENLKGGEFVIAMDERGAHAGSRDLAKKIGALRDDGCPVVTFVMGGPDGLDQSVRARADWTLAFGRLTWPHQLARVMLAEQLYRVTSVLAGHPYHRD